jgi:hypothetical protein
LQAIQGIPIGQILIDQGVLTAAQVDHILKVQKVSRRPFGDLAERLFGVKPESIEDAWVEQYVRLAGVTDLHDIEVDKNCLRVLNRRQAWQFHMLPANRDEMNLNVATDSEHLVKAVNFSTRRIDETVYMLIAEHEQLREFLMKHYPVPKFMADFSERM